MYETREYFGYLIDRSADWESTKKLELQFREKPSGKQMVRIAIQIAKRYNVSITKPLEYINDPSYGGRFLFEVKCHNLSYHHFFSGGNRQHYNENEVTEKDVNKYFELFGTRKCIQKGFKKKFWYSDNWTSKIHEFKTLKAAKKTAEQETGNVIYIYTNFPYGKLSKMVCKTDASGFTPP